MIGCRCKYDPSSPCCECDRCYGVRNNTMVYCKNCNHFELEENEDIEIPTCIHKDECDFNDYEEGLPFSDRLYYEE